MSVSKNESSSSYFRKFLWSPGQVRMGYPPPPGQVIPRAVCLLRFPAGGLSCLLILNSEYRIILCSQRIIKNIFKISNIVRECHLQKKIHCQRPGLEGTRGREDNSNQLKLSTVVYFRLYRIAASNSCLCSNHDVSQPLM